MLAEFAPFLVPQFDMLFVSLLALAGAFVALGTVTILHGFVRATVGGIAGLLVKLPGIGHVLGSPVNAVVHWMNHEFGAAELALDGVITRYLHGLGGLVRWWGREIGELSRALYVTASYLLGQTAVEALQRLVAIIAQRVNAVERATEAAIAHIGRLEAATEARIEHWIAPQLRAIEHVVDDVIPMDIAGLRARTRDTLDRLENVWSRVRGLDSLIGTATLAAVVAATLAPLGLSWIRCRNWRRIGEGVCGVPFGLIDALLGGVLEALVVTDLCDFAGLITSAAEEVRPELLAFVDLEGALIGCHGATSPPPLKLPPLKSPPVPFPIALAG